MRGESGDGEMVWVERGDWKGEGAGGERVWEGRGTSGNDALINRSANTLHSVEHNNLGPCASCLCAECGPLIGQTMAIHHPFLYATLLQNIRGALPLH